MAKKIGNSKIDAHRARAEAFSKAKADSVMAEFSRGPRVGPPPAKPDSAKADTSKRRVSSGALGSSGDVKDRFRDVYQPGAHPPPKPGLRSPMETFRVMKEKFTRKKGKY